MHLPYNNNLKGHIRTDTDYISVQTHGDFIVLPHWETRPSSTSTPIQPHYLYTEITQSLPHPNNVEHLARTNINSVSHWFDSISQW